MVYDLFSVFDSKETRILNKKIVDYEKVLTNQIAILTVDSKKTYDNIQKYGTDVASMWGLGDKKKNNGLLVILCDPCRKISICTGYGTEKIITDSICKNLITNTIGPSFKKGEYFNGIKAC